MLLAKLVAEVHDLECLVSNFNAAIELCEEDTEEGHGIAALELQTLPEAHQCLSDIIDLQRRYWYT